MEPSQSIDTFASCFARHRIDGLLPAFEGFQRMAADTAVDRCDDFELVDAPVEMVWDGFFYPERW